jgi:hypothetical protein
MYNYIKLFLNGCNQNPYCNDGICVYSAKESESDLTDFLFMHV